MTEQRAPYAAGETAQKRWSTAEIERLLAEGTPAPWTVIPFAEIGALMDDPDKCFIVADCDLWGNDMPENRLNANLIAAAPAIIRQLLDDKRTLRTERDEWTKIALKIVQDHPSFCDACAQVGVEARKALAATQP